MMEEKTSCYNMKQKYTCNAINECVRNIILLYMHQLKISILTRKEQSGVSMYIYYIWFSRETQTSANDLMC